MIRFKLALVSFRQVLRNFQFNCIHLGAAIQNQKRFQVFAFFIRSKFSLAFSPSYTWWMDVCFGKTCQCNFFYFFTWLSQCRLLIGQTRLMHKERPYSVTKTMRTKLWCIYGIFCVKLLGKMQFEKCWNNNNLPFYAAPFCWKDRSLVHLYRQFMQWV